MTGIFIASDNIITSLGFTTAENFNKLKQNETGLKITDDPSLSPVPLPLSSVDTVHLEKKFSTLVSNVHPRYETTPFTRMEKLFILSIQDAIERTSLDLAGPETLLVLSTTKGNIDLLGAASNPHFDSKRLYLWELARVIKEFFRFYNTPIVISNACISGSLAIGMGARLLSSGRYRNAIVAGGDILSKFVVSGFQSFQALSPEPCKPFDLARNGLSLGEGCSTMILTTSADTLSGDLISIAGFATSNDANHISGPSRTGEELALAINRSLTDASVPASGIDFISAHGTATLYNDEMESKALSLARLSGIPVNSFKGYTGHTLGAAGVIEAVATIQSMRSGILIRSIGFSEKGVEGEIAIIEANRPANLVHCLKTASGFGGCNSSIVISKK
jgi:3-oxoacyl-[acyl-carrier-protein] synthase I